MAFSFELVARRPDACAAALPMKSPVIPLASERGCRDWTERCRQDQTARKKPPMAQRWRARRSVFSFWKVRDGALISQPL
jgi:hypothetical protein